MAEDDKELARGDETGADDGVIARVEERLPEDDGSTLVIDSDVVEKIVAIACRSVDGILQMKGNLISSIQEGFGGTDITKGVQVEMVGDDACTVSVSIIMEYGKSARKIFEELHDRVNEKITGMTGLAVKAVNVRVVNVMTREELDGGHRKPAKDAREKDARDKARDDQPAQPAQTGEPQPAPVGEE